MAATARRAYACDVAPRPTPALLTLLPLLLPLAGCLHQPVRLGAPRPLPPLPARAAGPAPAAPAPASQPCALRHATFRLDAPPVDRTAPGPSRRNLAAWIDLLAGPAAAGRRAGSPAAAAVARLLADELARAGWSPVLPDGALCQGFVHALGPDQNVVARLPAPAGAPGPTIVVGAHYDALGVRGGRLHPGADDDASGVAALLEVARLLPRLPRRPAADVILAFFGSEEHHARGSRHFVANPPVPLERVALMVNVDQVGRQLLDRQGLARLFGRPRDAFGYTVSLLGRAAVEARVRRASNRTRTIVVGIPEGLITLAGFWADSLSFSGRVPALMLSTSIHDDYHRPTDTAARIDLGQVERAVRFVLALLDSEEGER
jgi:hypothetical protein